MRSGMSCRDQRQFYFETKSRVRARTIPPTLGRITSRAFAKLGSARVSRAGERVLAIANFPLVRSSALLAEVKKRLFRRDAETSTADARATRSFHRRMSTIPDRALPSPAQLYDRPLYPRAALRTLPSQNQTLAPRPLPVA